MAVVGIRLGPLAFAARWEETSAPRTCAAFRRLLPYRQRIIQARWSGEAGWIPLGDFDLGVRTREPHELPGPRRAALLPGWDERDRDPLPLRAARFASVKGPLAGNHFLTIVEGREQLGEMGRLLCWEGAQDITFEA